MNYRKVTIHPRESLSSAGTKTITIRGVDVISRILIKFELYKSKHDMDNHAASDITKIELVDGSDALFSMTGLEAQALNIYDRKCGSMCKGQHMASCYDETWYGLDFGRYLFDPELALDPKQFTNLQLKITYTLTTADTGASAARLEVFADVFDEKVVTPVGFLMSKEYYSYSCGDDGSYEYIDLPTDYPMRKMLVRAYTASYEPHYSIESVRLDEDNLKRTPIDIAVESYVTMMMSEWQEVEEALAVITYTLTERTWYTTPANYFPSVAGVSTGDELISSPPGWPRGGAVTLYSHAGGQNFFGLVRGYCPNHCVEFPFGDPKDMNDWYDVTKIDNLRLRLESGDSGSSGAAAVILQQLRKY